MAIQDQSNNHQSIKSKIRKPLVVAISAIALVSVAGITSSTFAWYSYQKSVSLDFTGTAISNSELIVVGLRADHRLNTPADVRPELNNKHFEDYYAVDFQIGNMEVEEVTINSEINYVYWIHDTYIQDILAKFAYSIHSGVDTLPAVTTGYFQEGMNWDLGNRDAVTEWNGFKKTPTEREEERQFSEFAEKKDYFYLPLVFQVLGGENYAERLGDKPVYLSKFYTVDQSFNAESPTNLAKAVRCKVDYPTVTSHSEDFVFDPFAEDSYQLKVAGSLNLAKNAYLDYDIHADGYAYERAFGQFNGVPEYFGPWAEDPTIPFNQCTTFKANHLKGAYCIDDSNARTCETRSRDIINPSMDGTPLIRTDAASKLGCVDLSIYLEGWDHNVIDQNLNHVFAVALEFAID